MSKKFAPKDLARDVRLQCLRMVYEAKASHIGSCFSIADIVAVLYGSVMNLRAKQPDWDERDRFILSKGHSAAAVYSVLALQDYFPLEDLRDYGKNNSKLMTHISHKVDGVEFSTGSLGHGLPFAAGKAMAAKLCGKSWKTYVLLSDGEMDEGSNWEALMFSSHHKLDNLVVIIDYNKLQSLGSVSETLGLEPLKGKLEAFGFSVLEVDGHDLKSLESALSNHQLNKGIPTAIIAHTIKGRGVKFMENKVEWHYKSPSYDEFIDASREIELNYAQHIY